MRKYSLLYLAAFLLCAGVAHAEANKPQEQAAKKAKPAAAGVNGHVHGATPATAGGTVHTESRMGEHHEAAVRPDEKVAHGERVGHVERGHEERGRHEVREHHEFREHDVHRFNHAERERWRSGRWNNTCWGGQCGWWWFAGGQWYFYDRPVYPYPLAVAEVTYLEPVAVAAAVSASSVVVAAPAPITPVAAAPQFWYYCDNPAGYYPYVATCNTSFRQVPAQPPGRH